MLLLRLWLGGISTDMGPLWEGLGGRRKGDELSLGLRCKPARVSLLIPGRTGKGTASARFML